jgi:hypothetical protein
MDIRTAQVDQKLDERRVYQAPAVVDYGNAAELTMGISTCSLDSQC